MNRIINKLIKKLNTKYKRILFLIISFLLIFLIVISLENIYYKYRIKHATVKIDFIDNLNIEVYSDIKVKDLIRNINGKIIDNYKINTNKLGKKEVTFTYINEENIEIPYTFKIKIVDTTSPIISQSSYKSIEVGSTEKDLINSIFCGDNYDDKPNCLIEGDINYNEVGSYPITFVAIDSSNNISKHAMTINVINKVTYSNNYLSTSTGTDIKEYIDTYKNKKTKVGIDVSHWQENIDYKKVKSSGVEFAFIRLGVRRGIDGKIELDEKFTRNIKGFNKVNIPVGVYFFSYAKTKEDALEEAKFVVKNLKKYDIELPVVFDWENFSNYREYNLSFYHLTKVADTFLNYVEEKGYTGMLYSSKYPLENYWYKLDHKIWLAHYTDKTNYEGKYYVWQMSDSGKVDGIDTNVDIDILYI